MRCSLSPPRHSIIVLTSLLVLGCASTMGRPVELAVPEIEDFAESGLPFDLAGARDDVRRNISDRLVDMSRMIRPLTIEPNAYLITVYVEEPHGEDDPRVRRTSYMFRIQERGEPEGCTQVLLAWFVQSRGKNELTWRATPEDAGHVPSGLEQMKGILDTVEACS